MKSVSKAIILILKYLSINLLTMLILRINLDYPMVSICKELYLHL